MTKKIKSDEIKRLAERIAKGKKTTITRQQLKEMVIQELGTLAVNDKVISNAMKSLSELLSDDNFRRAAGTQFQTAVQKVLTGLRDMRNAQKHESVSPESERFPKKGDIVQGPGGTGKISRVGDFDVIVDWDWSYEGNAHPQIKINKLQWNGKRWITK